MNNKYLVRGCKCFMIYEIDFFIIVIIIYLEILMFFLCNVVLIDNYNNI